MPCIKNAIIVHFSLIHPVVIIAIKQFSSSNNLVSSCCMVDFLQMVLPLSLAACRILFDFATNC